MTIRTLQRAPQMPSADFDRFYAAVQARDPAFDGRFFTAVRSTGIFCRPVCPARTPKPENCVFYASAAAALAAGFRACRRCRPESAPQSAAWRGARAIVDRAVREMVPAHGDLARVPGSAEAEAARLGIGARHRRRLFRTHLGRSPRDVALDARLACAERLLAECDETLTEIAIRSGFGDLRQFQRAVRRRRDCTPGELRARLRHPARAIQPRGAPMSGADFSGIGFVGTADVSSPLGPLLVAFAQTGPGRDLHLVSLDFAPFSDRFTALLRKRFSGAAFRPEPAPTAITTALEAWFAGSPEALAAIPLWSAGTAFQEYTWQALRAIPVGQTRAYRDIAAAIGAPRAIRAVARANALNPIAIATPCHRVIGADGTLTGYAGGLARKALLLEHERAIAAGARSTPLNGPPIDWSALDRDG